MLSYLISLQLTKAKNVVIATHTETETDGICAVLIKTAMIKEIILADKAIRKIE